jgi:hypothetical protein
MHAPLRISLLVALYSWGRISTRPQASEIAPFHFKSVQDLFLFQKNAAEKKNGHVTEESEVLKREKKKKIQPPLCFLIKR